MCEKLLNSDISLERLEVETQHGKMKLMHGWFHFLGLKEKWINKKNFRIIASLMCIEMGHVHASSINDSQTTD